VDTVLGNRLIEIRARIVDGFDAGNWEEIGLLTGATDLISRHARLLRSLMWGDEDYAGNVLTVLRQIVERDPLALVGIESFVSAKPAARRITFAPHVFQVPDGHVELDLVAVMMPFGMEFDAVYESIKRATSECALRCLRADDIWEESTIAQDIFRLIFRSQVVVVHFTGRNPNVMYETGIAHTLGKHVVPITQRIADAPFDMQHHRALLYHPNGEGLTQLSSKLAVKLRQFSIGSSGCPSPRRPDEGDVPF
jgi:hypothetical protein